MTGTLTNTYVDRSGRFFALWSIDGARCIHQRLPKTCQSEVDAWILGARSRT